MQVYEMNEIQMERMKTRDKRDTQRKEEQMESL